MSGAVQWLLRLVYGRYVPEPVRNSLRTHFVLLARDREPQRVPLPAGRVVVLAPHMDDEVFGCGGTLARAVAAGATVTTIYLTDGSRGYAKPARDGRSRAEIDDFERALSRTRRGEAAAAAAVLGLRPPVFLDLPDGRLAVSADAVGRLAGALARERPAHVFLPFFTDIHHDHWLTNGVFVEAAAAAKLPDDVRCWGYEVWTPVPANSVVDVTDVVERKRLAMAAFASQQEYDYGRAFEALMVYRSLFTRHGSGFAEAFYTADLAVYRRLYASVAVGHRRRRGPAPPRGPAREASRPLLTEDATRA
jgi:LmbE family N-acetylglucosaminyl deacetylase